ncbi:damage-inducible protein DinB [Vibrio cholerae]|uniref:DinB family protein n=3 Tax=Vibrio cholerae TaxID=666 RepID=UPI0015831DF3|nr:DinB family protein [Vibrio cholerae]EKA4523397.1 DinB family protein [Vibrio cholerae]EKJ1030853.1 DinB family protein [Vibrio cholerae]ELT6289736.1 DinB family protein [Vibrio cholerae]QKU72283.1 damage-inducible protein DinB [Vibrio cholerae]QKU72426.1 damage-inducible protein DinB [Vibrio cholerae]
MQFASAFQYKKWANDELLELGEKQFSQLPENDATFFVRILNHTTVVDSLFISRILGEPEKYSGDNTVETPSLSELRRTMNEHDSWLVDFTQSVSTDELKRNVTFRFIDGGFGQLTVEEILLHLLTHGSNHRGMASRVLAENGLERPKDTFTRYLHETEPTRRESSGI